MLDIVTEQRLNGGFHPVLGKLAPFKLNDREAARRNRASASSQLIEGGDNAFDDEKVLGDLT